jgi:hypothetical protein
MVPFSSELWLLAFWNRCGNIGATIIRVVIISIILQSYGAFVAIVIDPIRSLTKSKVEIGAFRVYP